MDLKFVNCLVNKTEEGNKNNSEASKFTEDTRRSLLNGAEVMPEIENHDEIPQEVIRVVSGGIAEILRNKTIINKLDQTRGEEAGGGLYWSTYKEMGDAELFSLIEKYLKENTQNINRMINTNFDFDLEAKVYDDMLMSLNENKKKVEELLMKRFSPIVADYKQREAVPNVLFGVDVAGYLKNGKTESNERNLANIKKIRGLDDLVEYTMKEIYGWDKEQFVSLFDEVKAAMIESQNPTIVNLVNLLADRETIRKEAVERKHKIVAHLLSKVPDLAKVVDVKHRNDLFLNRKIYTGPDYDQGKSGLLTYLRGEDMDERKEVVAGIMGNREKVEEVVVNLDKTSMKPKNNTRRSRKTKIA